MKDKRQLIAVPNMIRIDKSKVLSLMIHCCDISHPTKMWDLHTIWTEKVSEEFFRQVRLIEQQTQMLN